MECTELYIRILCYCALIVITVQFIINLYFVENKMSLEYFFHMVVEIFYWYMSISFLFVIRVWKYPEIKKELKDLPISENQYPSIDILIPCYNEDEDLIKNTLLNAIDIDYPKELYNIYLLDDSKRESLKIICDEIGINYITRHVNRCQKSGNLNDFLKSFKSENLNDFLKSQTKIKLNSPENHAVIIQNYDDDETNNNEPDNNINFHSHHRPPPPPRDSSFNINPLSAESSTKSEEINDNDEINENKTSDNEEINENKTSDYICILDCDMIPKKNIFNMLVPYLFEDHEDSLAMDESIAIVQPRQYFYNCHYDTDYFDMDNSVYVKLIMPAMNEMNNTPYVGTNALISRKALYDVDYFFEGHATEDTITSLLMCSTLRDDGKLYKTKYAYPCKVAEGFAPETLAEAFDQRLRWIKGNIQLVMNENPLCKPNLDCEQKIAWLITNSFWIFGIFFLGQYISHLHVLISYATDKPKNSLQDKIIYQLSFITQIISFFLLPELTCLEKLRSLQMFICYIPVYIYSFLSHICGCLAISKVSNKGEQKHFHVLFIFHIIILLSIFGLSIFVLSVGSLDGWEYTKIITLIIAYIIVFYPVIKSLVKCLC
jgi:cellulose synthase/poly-beta-1,6-N-acetylglucosamine synthase-like glycosyltransferase